MSVQMKKQNLCPKLAAIFSQVVNLREELEDYGKELESSVK